MTINELEIVLKENRLERFSSKIILINSYKNVFELQKIYRSCGYTVKDLRTFQSKENQWFGVSRLNRKINQITGNTILFSVSEIIRFYDRDDFKSFFDNFFSIENRKYSVHIPLFGLKSRFYSQYFNTFYRRNEYSFVYELNSIFDKIDLNIVNFEVPFDNTLDTVKDWLNFYNLPTNNIICSPRPLVERIKNQYNDDIININYIDNQKEFIEKYMKKSFPLDFKEDEKEYWNRLIIDFQESNLKEILQKKLNLHNLTPIEMIQKICQEQDLYIKWLLKGYSLEFCKNDSYFYRVIQNSNLNERLIDKIWFDIFDDYSLTHLKERFDILSIFYKNNTPSFEIENRLTKYLENCDYLTAILTGITTIEKKYIVELYTLNKIDIKYCQKYYKDLTSYMDSVDFINSIEWVEDYFKEYKKSKIENKISLKLADILKKQNQSQNSFFNWYADTTFKEVADFQIIKEKTLWIDGLGIEWLGVIKNYALSKGYACDFYISRANLPTITKCNRFKGIEKTEKLDNYIHKQKAYRYPLNLIEEINIIKEILDSYLHDELTIVSDHGFSAFCSFQTKINSFSGDEHEGRCAKIEELLDDNNYFSYDFQCGRYLVSLNHNSLNNKTRREAHGGATPEEVIVPIIKIYKTKNKEKIKSTEFKSTVKKGFEEDELF